MANHKSKRLREIRLGLGLSQLRFGVAMGFDNPSDHEIEDRVERYESGDKEPPETILRLAEMLFAHGIPEDFWTEDYPNDAAEQFQEICHRLRVDGQKLSVIDMAVVMGFKGADKTVSSQVRRYADGSREIPPWTLRLAIMLGRFGVPDAYLDDNRERI